MPAIILDTLKYSQALQDAGADKKLADAIATGLGSADTTSFATKDDIAGVKTEIAGLRSDLNTEIGNVKTEIAELRSDLNTEIADLRSDLSKEIASVNTRLTTQFWAQTSVFVLLMVPIFIAIYQN